MKKQFSTQSGLNSSSARLVFSVSMPLLHPIRTNPVEEIGRFADTILTPVPTRIICEGEPMATKKMPEDAARNTVGVNPQNPSEKDFKLTKERAEELYHKFKAFREGWEAPGMEAYDNL